MPEPEIDPRALLKMIVVLIAHLQNAGLIEAEELAATLRSATGDDEFDYQLHALADAISPKSPDLSVIDGGKNDQFVPFLLSGACTARCSLMPDAQRTDRGGRPADPRRS